MVEDIRSSSAVYHPDSPTSSNPVEILMIISDTGWMTEELPNGNIKFWRDIIWV